MMQSLMSMTSAATKLSDSPQVTNIKRPTSSLFGVPKPQSLPPSSPSFKSVCTIKMIPTCPGLVVKIRPNPSVEEMHVGK
jgi:hypothetical protein